MGTSLDEYPVDGGEAEPGSLVASLVVKKGSNARSMTSAVMPVPVSLTCSWT